MRTYDDHLREQEALSIFTEADDYERCEMCGDRCHHEDFDDYKGQRMCPDCIELERINDAAEALRPDYSQLFKAV